MIAVGSLSGQPFSSVLIEMILHLETVGKVVTHLRQMGANIDGRILKLVSFKDNSHKLKGVTCNLSVLDTYINPGAYRTLCRCETKVIEKRQGPFGINAKSSRADLKLTV